MPIRIAIRVMASNDGVRIYACFIKMALLLKRNAEINANKEPS